MPEIPGVSAKIGADVSGYKSGMTDAADATKKLGDASNLTRDQILQLSQATDKQRETLLLYYAAGVQSVDITKVLTNAEQALEMSKRAAHEQALKLNEAMNQGAASASAFGAELLNMVGLGVALEGGFAVATAALQFLKAATIDSIESFVDFGVKIDLIHEKLGVSRETAAAWEESASVTGASAERITSSLAMMDQRLEEGNKKAIVAINTLGISMADLRDATPDQKMEMLSRAFQQLEANGGKADVVVKELMGRGGLGMLPEFSDWAEQLNDKIKEINGPLEEQSKTAMEYAKNAALLDASWQSIRRSIMEPVVGGLAAVFKEASTNPLGVINPLWRTGAYGAPPTNAESPFVGPMPESYWGAAAGNTANVVATQADIDRADRAGIAEQERAAREKLRQEMELDRAARQTDTETTKLWTEAEALAARAAEMSLPPLDAAVAKADEQYDVTTRNAYAILTKAQATGTDTQATIEAVNAVIKEASAVRDATIAKAEDRQESEDAKAQHKEITKALNEEGVALYEAALQARQHEAAMHSLGATIEDVAGGIMSLLQAIGHSGGTLGSLVGGVGQGANVFMHSLESGVLSYGDMISSAGSVFAAGQKGGAGAGALAGLGEGATIGMLFGPGGAAIGAAIGGAVGLIGAAFHSNPEYKKVMDGVGHEWGVDISEGLAKAIESTETKDNVSRNMAELLNIDQIIKESGDDPGSFAGRIGDLMNAVATNSVPAKEGVAELGKAFDMLRQAAEAGSEQSEAAMIQMIQRARQLGETIPGMEQYITQTLQGGVGGLDAFFSGIMGSPTGGGWTAKHAADLQAQLSAGTITQGQYNAQKQALLAGQTGSEWSPGVASANEKILGANFSALSAQEGVVKAAEDMQKAFDELMKHIGPGQTMDKSVEHMAHIEQLLQDANFKAAAEASVAGAQDLKALLDTGNLTQDTTDAFASDTEALLQQSIQAAKDNGFSPDEARIAGEEANAPLLAQLQHAQELGTKLTPEAEAMLRQAQADGTLPLKTVAEQQLDELRGIHGALDHGYSPPGGGAPTPTGGSGTSNGTGAGNGGASGGGETGGGPQALRPSGGGGHTFIFNAHGVNDPAQFLAQASRILDRGDAAQFISSVTRQQART